MGYTIEDFKNGVFVINCKTNKEADDFAKICDENNMTWSCNGKVSEKTNWGEYRERTCYNFRSNLSYATIEFYQEGGRKMISFQDFVLDNKSNKEKVLESIGVEVGKPFNVSGDSYNPYVFDDNYNLIDKDGEKREDLIFAMLWDGLKIEKISEDPNAEVKKHIELISNKHFGRNNAQEAILFLLNEILELKESKSA